MGKSIIDFKGEIMNKFYLDNSTEDINSAENKYDYLPTQQYVETNIKSLNQICYGKTMAIAKAHQKKLTTTKLERDLSSCRSYAIRIFE